MNQHQRKFLIEAIEKQYKAEVEELRESEPQAPSLNNYMIAAILDGSFQLKSVDALREAITERVRNLGKSESLMHSDSNLYRRRRRGEEDDDYTTTVNVPAAVLFEMPEPYQQALDAYKEAHAKWRAKMKAMEAAMQAMRIKIQIGSDSALGTLIEQADTLCAISITAASKLFLKN